MPARHRDPDERSHHDQAGAQPRRPPVAVPARPRRSEQAGRAATGRTAPEPGAGGDARRAEPALPGVPGAVPGPADRGRAQAARRGAADHADRAARRGRERAARSAPPGRHAVHQQADASRMPPADHARRRRADRVQHELWPGRGAGQLRRAGRHHCGQDGRGHGHRRATQTSRSPSRSITSTRPSARAGACWCAGRPTASRTRRSCVACRRTPRSGRGQAASARSTCGSCPVRSPVAASSSGRLPEVGTQNRASATRRPCSMSSATGGRPPRRPGRPAGRCNPTRCRTSRTP